MKIKLAVSAYLKPRPMGEVAAEPTERDFAPTGTNYTCGLGLFKVLPQRGRWIGKIYSI